ncbi:DNA methyltransferase [Mesorhizobium sp.]|uniref:DNA methyltransferase n=1 Tax=Mesorhizobium sp. TaxID=1871066 RepID=UPI00121E766A|nr:MAG: site-specific DNA-methyltransferase [Mesorhizobium sp.]
MFPLAFPLKILSRAAKNDLVLDPFCGRGTTNYAARLLGLDSVGVDSSPVAAAITAAKLVGPLPSTIVAEASDILAKKAPCDVPRGDFWDWAFHAETLLDLCKFRAALLEDCTTSARIALRGIILGALHGPRQKTAPSYFSNQSPRTYAPKPAYAVRFWRDRELEPPRVELLDVIRRRAGRYYSAGPQPLGIARLGDSRTPVMVAAPSSRFSWVVTSPPYYGMRTYLPDQWLRNWFLGGPPEVDYGTLGQVSHKGPDIFASDLRKVWKNGRAASADGARLVIRFGGIADRSANPHEIIMLSLAETGWRTQTVKPAGSASDGKRQANSFLRNRSEPIEEFVVWARAA